METTIVDESEPPIEGTIRISRAYDGEYAIEDGEVKTIQEPSFIIGNHDGGVQSVPHSQIEDFLREQGFNDHQIEEIVNVMDNPPYIMPRYGEQTLFYHESAQLTAHPDTYDPETNLVMQPFSAEIDYDSFAGTLDSDETADTVQKLDGQDERPENSPVNNSSLTPKIPGLGS